MHSAEPFALADLAAMVHMAANSREFSLLLQERNAGDLEQVARLVHEKLVRRHPHVFAGEKAPDDLNAVWEQRKKAEPQIVIRFWIIAVVLALAGLSTLKLR